MDDLYELLERVFAEQSALVMNWHDLGYDRVDLKEAFLSSVNTENIEALVYYQHKMNFDLWHVEDVARRKDVDLTVIAKCKFKIDKLNQARNDLIEKIDQQIVGLIHGQTVSNGDAKYATETIGMCIDRMSILALKIYHMNEQTERENIDKNYRDTCQRKSASLQGQRLILEKAVNTLVDEYLSGSKIPHHYYQHKMYNDPLLNPQLNGEETFQISL